MLYSKTKTVENRKPVKGDVIYVIGVWSGFQRYNYNTRAELNHGPVRVYYRKLIVQSWGPKQGTFTDAATGEFIRERGYTDTIHGEAAIAWAFTVEGLTQYLPEIESHHRDSLASSLKIDRDTFEKYAGAWNPSKRNAAASLLAAHEAYTLSVVFADYADCKAGSVA